MINNFLIYSHPIITIQGAGSSENPDFLTTYDVFNVENRVTNGPDLVQQVLGALYASVQTSAYGGTGLLNQDAAADVNLWLPRYRNAQVATEPYQVLKQQQRITFTYNNPGVNPIANLQSSYLGKLVWRDDSQVSLDRPFTYYTPVMTVPAGLGASVTTYIQIQATGTDMVSMQPGSSYDTGLYCQAFLGTNTGGFGSVAVNIRDTGTGYNFMNTPVVMENFTYDLRVEGAAFPRGFNPFVMPSRHRYEIQFINLVGRESYQVQLAFFGQQCSYSY